MSTTTVRLEFELDSEVYPELHAALSSLRNTRARAERMRQLAAAGLVWEKVRLHGSTAAVALTPAMEERPDVVTRADVNAETPSESMPLPALERRASKRARAITADKRDDPGFVDLAINAEPTPVPLTRPERQRARPTRRDVEQVMRELPVLMDVVVDVHQVDVHQVDVRQVDESEGDEPTDTPDDDSFDMPVATLHVAALSHKPATRSRLMRMKERGLFKNG